MKTVSVNYRRTFNLGNYASEVVGVEIELDPTDNPEDALLEAKNLVEQFHHQNNSQVHGVQQTINNTGNGLGENTHKGVELKSEPEYKTAIQLLKEKQDKEIDGYIAAINLAENEKTLRLYLKRVTDNGDPSNEKHMALRMAYELKYEKLKQEPYYNAGK